MRAPPVAPRQPAPQADASRPVASASRRDLRRRLRRRALLAVVVPALAAIAIGVAALRWWSAELVARLPIGSDAERFLDPLYERIARAAAERGRPAAEPLVVLFGDSVVFGAAPEIAAELERLRTRAEVVPIVAPLLRPVHYVFLLDLALAAAPAAALVEVNSVWLDPPAGIVDRSWQERLSRHLATRRAPRIAGALLRDQASVFDPWLFRLEERLGLLFAAPGLRRAGQDAIAAASSATGRALGLAPGRAAGAPRATAWVAAAYAGDLAGGANVALLRELRCGLGEAGVAAVFFVPPVNEAELRRLGSPAPEDLAARLERLRVAAGIPAGQWIDLHALVPPEEFRDVLGHLDPPGRRRLADALARAAATALGPGDGDRAAGATR